MPKSTMNVGWSELGQTYIPLASHASYEYGGWVNSATVTGSNFIKSHGLLASIGRVTVLSMINTNLLYLLLF